MKAVGIRRAAAVVAAAALASLAGCVTPQKSLYYWGDYQPMVYSHLNGGPAEAQQAKLQETAHQAQSQGDAVPPGFNAHLGLLYLNTGRLDLAQSAFQTEAVLFPESKPYMDFLLRKFANPATGAAR